MNPVKVLLVDDHAEFRRVVHEFLSKLPHVTVVGEAANGEEAVSQVKRLHPDLVLMDVSLPLLNGFDATRIIKKGWPEIKVLITTVNDGDAYRKQADAVHADGFVPKTELKRGLEAAFGISSPTPKEVFFPKSSQ
jgi:DNA-binding NarL/FixJ family response regulator